MSSDKMTEQPARLMLEIPGAAEGAPICLSYMRAGKGRPVLLLHGFASDACSDWVETGWINALVASGYDVVAPDMRGHGRSAKLRDPANYRLEAFAADLVALSRACWADAPFSLVGYSMGAHVAMTLALTCSGQIDRLVLGGMGERIVSSVGLAPEFADALDQFDPNATDGAARALPAYAIRFREHAASRSFNDLEVLASCLRGQTTTFETRRLSSVTAPTLVIVGDQDKLAGSPNGVAALFPNGIAASVSGPVHASALADQRFRMRAIEHLRMASAGRPALRLVPAIPTDVAEFSGDA